MKTKMKSWHKMILPVLFIALLAATYLLLLHNKKLKNSLPYLVKNEKMKYFNLISSDSQMVDLDSLAEQALVFIFAQPCSTCNHNFQMWQQMATILKKRGISIYGIVLSGESEMAQLAEYKGLKFKVYVPENKERFIKAFRIHMNMAQTILCQNSRVKLLHLGDLSAEDYHMFLREGVQLGKKMVSGGQI